jgi:two-component system, NtrC family, sensor histidine kinase PilS
MRNDEIIESTAFRDDSERVFRLLSLYRIVAAVGAFAMLVTEPGSITLRPFSFAFIAFYVLLHVAALLNGNWVLRHPRWNLTLMALVDTLFVVLAVGLGGSLLFAAASLPIMITHGWLLRDQTAIAHSVILVFATLALAWVIGFPLTQAGFLGIGFLIITALGIFLGRTSRRAMDLADKRGEVLEQLSALNQRIIDEIDQGILVVDRDGVLLQANPQAERWLYAAGLSPQLPQPLITFSTTLATQLANWRENHPMTDSNIVLGSGEAQIRVKARFLSTELRREGDTVVFLEDLRVAQQRAQQIKLAALGRLTANIAHEIRNPLSAIRQAGQLLGESDDATDAAQRKLTEMIEKNVRRIDRIVTNVLSLSKRDKVMPQVFLAEKVLREIAQDWQDQTQTPPGALQVTIEPALVLRFDAGHLEEILWNLLGNAWRHSQKKAASLQLVARRSASQRVAIIEVTDDGPGVPPEHRESVFEPFFSLSASSGLGLYISRELAESNGGTLELTSHSPGAQFRLILPTIANNEFANT